MSGFPAFAFRVPATSANLGPGFDSFGLALNLYNEFTVTASDSFAVTIKGYSDPELERHESNLVFSIYKQLCHENNWRPRTFSLLNNNNIPLYGGIGSSASAIVAGIFIANTIHKAGWDKEQILKIAYGFESHLDNIAAAVFGGFVATSFNERKNRPVLIQKEITEPLKAWMVVPHLRVSTTASRVAMPTSISYQDAVFNLAHATQVALAFERQQWNLLAQAMRDRLHQPFRNDQCAGLLHLSESMQEAGAYSLCLSGSGPAVLILCDKVTEQMQQLIEQHLKKRKTDYSDFQLNVDNKGVSYLT